MAPRLDLDGFRDGRISVVRAVHYDTADGMKTSEASNPASQPGGWRTRDGKLWFTTQKGIVVVDPRRLQHNDRIPPVVIEEVVADGARLSPAPGLRIDSQRRARLSRRAAERAHDGSQPERLVGIPPLADLVQDVSHAVSPQGSRNSGLHSTCPPAKPARPDNQSLNFPGPDILTCSAAGSRASSTPGEPLPHTEEGEQHADQVENVHHRLQDR